MDLFSLAKLIGSFKEYLCNLNDFCDLFLVYRKNGELNKIASFFRTTFTLMGLLVFYLVFMLLVKNHDYTRTEQDQKVIEKIKYNIQECGNHNYISWIVVRDEQLLGFPISSKELRFKEVYGCQKLDNEKCKFHEVENVLDQPDHNPVYDKVFDIEDEEDYKNIFSMKEGVIENHMIQYSDDGEITNDSLPQIMKDILSQLRLRTKFISYTVVKDFRQQLIYIFVSSYTIMSRNSCSMQTNNALLLDLARTAKLNSKLINIW